MIWRKVKHIFAVFQIFLTDYSSNPEISDKMRRITQMKWTGARRPRAGCRGRCRAARLPPRHRTPPWARGLRLRYGAREGPQGRCRAARQPPRPRPSPWVGAGSAYGGAAGGALPRRSATASPPNPTMGGAGRECYGGGCRAGVEAGRGHETSLWMQGTQKKE